MKTGDVIAWAVVDRDSGQVICIFTSRARARYAAGKDARIAKIVVAK